MSYKFARLSFASIEKSGQCLAVTCKTIALQMCCQLAEINYAAHRVVVVEYSRYLSNTTVVIAQWSIIQ